MFDKVFFIDMLFKCCLEFDCSLIELLFFIISSNYNYIFYIIKNMKQKWYVYKQLNRKIIIKKNKKKKQSKQKKKINNFNPYKSILHAWRLNCV
jgi:hypothetical protein